MKKYFFLFIFYIFSIKCNTSKENVFEQDLLYTDSINAPSLQLPNKISMCKCISDSLFYSISQSKDGDIYKLYFNNALIDTLKIENSIGFTVFDEGDLDGDGYNEIGLLNAYPTSSCRMYEVFSIKKNKWKMLHKVRTHLKDRKDGVDYFKLTKNRLRIINANQDSCCQCGGLDTGYVTIEK